MSVIPIAVALGGDNPIAVPGIELSGYHRPLGGEVANLTVTVAHDEFFEDWLACPPLGVACNVAHGAEPLIEGYLFGLRVDSGKVELRIEG